MDERNKPMTDAARKPDSDNENALGALRHTLSQHREGLRDIGFLLVEDGHWEMGSWLHAVAMSTRMQALPSYFIMTFGEHMQERLSVVEDNFIGWVANPATFVALQKALAKTLTDTLRASMAVNPRRHRLAVPKTLHQAIARTYPNPDYATSGTTSPRVHWMHTAPLL